MDLDSTNGTYINVSFLVFLSMYLLLCFSFQINRSHFDLILIYVNFPMCYIYAGESYRTTALL
jgi:hypothetical protein